eukprot:427733_1
MDDLDLTQGLCGWNQNEMENDDQSSEISHEMELKNMFNKLKIVNHHKRPNIHTQRPKSSTINTTRRKPREQNISKTARTLPKQNRNKSTTLSTSRNRSSEYSRSIHSKTSNKALIKAYLPQSHSRKKLQRSHSNLYIRDTHKNVKKPHDHSKHSKKPKSKPKTNSLDLQLNLDAITNVAEPVVFSEALFQNKYQETLNEINTNKNSKRKLKHDNIRGRSELSKDELSLQYSQKSKVLKNVNDYYKRQLIKNTPFLTPSTSMVSLHEHRHTKSISKSKQGTSKPKPNFAKPKKKPFSSKTARSKTTRRKLSKLDTKTNAIPIKCFNSNVLTARTLHPKSSKLNAESMICKSRIFVNLTGRRKEIKNIRSQSVDISDDKENDGVNDSHIVKYHRKMIRGKENSKCEEYDEHMSLEQKLRSVIARWESHEKMKARKSSRSRRIPVFQ